MGFTTGLIKSVASNNKAIAKTFWLIDNSGSMYLDDGHRTVQGKSKRDTKVFVCSRWKELQTCIDFHIDRAALFKSPTVFMFLNNPGSSVGPQRFSVAEHVKSDISQDVSIAKTTLRKVRPAGYSPLTTTLLLIKSEVEGMVPQLLHTGQRVAIVLATDGLPTDQDGEIGSQGEAASEFLQALKSLESLPVYIIIRLCTDDREIVEFYNSLDKQLERPLEVLNDFIDESEEVRTFNEWLNYAMPLHRCRESGCYDQVLDMLDERSLTKGEVLDLLKILFGDDVLSAMPNPSTNWGGFIKCVRSIVKKEGQEWNPAIKKVLPWIDVNKLNKEYGGRDSNCVIS